MTSVFLVGGARPNFMKIAPIYHAFRRSSAFEITLVSTGQHYDGRMAGSFFPELGLPRPDVELNVGCLERHFAPRVTLLSLSEAVPAEGV